MFKYKIDVLQELKDHGYNTNKLRTEKLLGESAIQALRKNKVVGITSLDVICTLLNCQLSDILEHEPEQEGVISAKTSE